MPTARSFQYFMAEKTPMMDIVGDLTRESLIAISYSLPDEISASPDCLEKMTNGSNAVIQKDGSSMDNLRSELISLSYTSPVAETQPEVKRLAARVCYSVTM